jgi:thiol-disulfide isomerase/thioredoxin
MQAKTVGLIVAVAAIAGAILAIEQPWRASSATPPPPANLPASEAKFDAAPGFGGATAWLDSAPLDLAQLRGKVVLVDFWTYSCINCIHTFPHVEGYWQGYRADGLVVVGVHTPEFAFERNVDNIRSALQRYGLTYPVAVDSDYAVWDAYGNRYWPAEYLVDAYGRIRDTHFGEGNYADTETAIRQLLAEAGHPPEQPPGETAASGQGTSGPVSPELYVAGDRAAVANQPSYQDGAVRFYERPPSAAPDQITLVGNWSFTDQNATAGPEAASALVQFNGAGANAVLDGPHGACVEVLLDGSPIPADRAGKDVQRLGSLPCLLLDGPRSYDWYAGPLESHTVELVLPPGATLFTFDFSPPA